jgi:hypothetical protein
MIAGSALALAAALPTAAAAADAMPYAMPDDSWISIDGTIELVQPDSFTLDYGDGNIIVEMDDGDRDADAYKLIEGDKVNVIGKVDDDFFEATTIEAMSVYVQKLGTTFYASAVDEEDVVMTVTVPVDVSDTVVRGNVSSVGDDQFTVDMEGTELTVSTDDLGYDPLDEIGYQRIEKGDRVSVSGDMEDQFFGGTRLEANAIVELSDAQPGDGEGSAS